MAKRLDLTEQQINRMIKVFINTQSYNKAGKSVKINGYLAAKKLKPYQRLIKLYIAECAKQNAKQRIKRFLVKAEIEERTWKHRK